MWITVDAAYCSTLILSLSSACLSTMQACEYGMSVSAGVLVSVRGGLLAVWVQCKQLLQQPIPEKTFGIEDSVSINEISYWSSTYCDCIIPFRYVNV